MFCIKCGDKIEENAKFCKKCGEKIHVDNSTQNTKKRLLTGYSMSIRATMAMDTIIKSAKQDRLMILKTLNNGGFDLTDVKYVKYKENSPESDLFFTELILFYLYFLYAEHKESIDDEQMKDFLSKTLSGFAYQLKIKKQEDIDNFKTKTFSKFEEFNKLKKDGNLSVAFFERANDIFWPNQVNHMFRLMLQNFTTTSLSSLNILGSSLVFR